MVTEIDGSLLSLNGHVVVPGNVIEETECVVEQGSGRGL